MHMADALISPAVGGIMWAASVGAAAYSIKKTGNDIEQKKIPVMGVMGAFVFAAQMINFSIPMTGSSGHIGGGMLLSILLGPYAGFLTMASILAIQALFFADGGLLAFGCNVFNMGFYTCFIAYPLIYRRIIRRGFSAGRIFTASILSAVIGLQLGAFSVVLQTLFSGKTELPFAAFTLMMQPIHLAIGIVEGLITSAVVVFIWKARPEIVERTAQGGPIGNISVKRVVAALAVAAVITGGMLSWFASSYPDGLEWSVFNINGNGEIESSGEVHSTMSDIQSKTAFLPDYGFKAPEEGAQQDAEGGGEAWPSVNAGTSVSGLVGGVMTLVLAALAGLAIALIKRGKKAGAA